MPITSERQWSELDVAMEEYRPVAPLYHNANRCRRKTSTVYPRYGTETISIVGYMFGKPTISTISVEVAKQIVSTKGDYIKGEELSAPVTCVLDSDWL